MAGNFSALGIGGGAAKSYQHGVINLTGGNGTATISPVTSNKYVIYHQGSSSGTGSGAGTLVLTNSTTITASLGSGTGAFAYTIVEYY